MSKDDTVYLRHIRDAATLQVARLLNSADLNAQAQALLGKKKG